MPPRRKQVGKGKSPVVDVLDIEGITLEDAASPVLSKSKTTLHEVPKDILRNSLKKADFASFMRSTSAAKVFKEALEPEAHPEYVSKMHTLLSTQRKTLGAKIAIQESMDYSPAIQRMSYGVFKGFYTYDLATNTTVKYHNGGADNSIKKTAFSTDGSFIAAVDDLQFLRLWKYDAATHEYVFWSVHENDAYWYLQDIQLVSYKNHLFVVVITADDTIVVFQTMHAPRSPFIEIYRENKTDANINHISAHQHKVLITTSKGFKAYKIEPKPRAATEFQFTAVPWPTSTQFLHPYTISHTTAFDSTGVYFLTVHSAGLIQSAYSKTNALHVWKWADDTNRIEHVKELAVATAITEKDRTLWRMAAFSPNGRYIAALSFARSPDAANLYGSPCIDLWEVASGQHVRTIHLKTKTQTAKQVVQLGFFKKDNKDSIFCIDAGFHVYAFSPELSFTGGRRGRKKTSAPRRVRK